MIASHDAFFKPAELLQLHCSNREKSDRAMADAIEERRDPLLHLAIIVPNRAVEQFAKNQIAGASGSPQI